jgi:hypothetical protein
VAPSREMSRSRPIFYCLSNSLVHPSPLYVPQFGPLGKEIPVF